jgi:hypothetical protein
MNIPKKLLYNKYIYDIYSFLIKSNREINNKALSKIFEYYSCIELTNEYERQFLVYDDIEPDFKEENKMSRLDTGIDASDCIDTIVQCKLRENTLTLKDCCTFFASQNKFDEEKNKIIVKWNNLIITRNECKISKNLLEKRDWKLFTDKLYLKNDFIKYCNDLLENPPKIIEEKEEIKLRNYQEECIEIIKKNKNVIICLPTGCGKNVIIIFSMDENKKYLILVPRIILMDQLFDEMIRFRPELKNKIQTIGDGRNDYDENKLITICVYNSVEKIEKYCDSFDKIFIDEAHHIDIPEIYMDEEDEIDDESGINDNDEELNKNYIEIIKSLKKFNNNIYLSATIDEIEGFTYYKKDIRDMIENGYLCDYTIHIPIFSDNANQKTICEYLINKYRNIIIYCATQNEGKQVNEIMNGIMKDCSKYIDCNTKKKERKEIISKFSNNKIPFLINVRVLTEGFNCKITKGVCLFHMPNNKTTAIQVIGRSLRKHNEKIMANVILPFSNNDEEKTINKFMRSMAKNDKRIYRSYQTKKQGGYINFDLPENIDNETIELKYEAIYDKFGTLVGGTEYWKDKLEQVKKYIDENHERPSNKNKNKEIKQLGNWIQLQMLNFEKKRHIMKNEKIQQKWKKFIDEYVDYFKNNEELWDDVLDQVKKYIDENHKRPSKHDKNKEIKRIGAWIGTQLINFEKKQHIMKDEEKQKKWKKFIDEYEDYFKNNEEAWYDMLEQVKKYIDENHKRPSQYDKNTKQLNNWLQVQLRNFETKQQIMKNEEIQQDWKNFIEEYIDYFKSNEEIWNNMLEQVKKYIDENHKRPSKSDKNKKIKQLGDWMIHQTNYFENKQFLMKNEEIQQKWKNFVDEYSNYFESNEEIWNIKLEQVKKYIDENHNRPSCSNKNKEIKQLGNWIGTQKRNFEQNQKIMKNKEIREKWKFFVDEYNKYLKNKQ